MQPKRLTVFLARIALLCMTLFCAIFGSLNRNVPQPSQIRPDTWAATDGLSRTLPTKGEVRGKNARKFVGLFYWTWHTNFAQNHEALNATEILSAHPQILHDFASPLWQSTADGRPYFWGKPLFGYYRDTDAYVLRKHAELLADAGVDVIFFDCTNGTSTWDESTDALLAAFEGAKQDGVRVPQIAFMLPFNDSGDTAVSLHHLYDRLYAKSLYRDLWFFWDGKPLIMAHAGALNPKEESDREILDCFTFRKNHPSYFVSDKQYSEKVWGWCSDYPQTKYGKSLFGRTEQMCVSVAQNAADGRLTAMNAGGNVQGRSFVKDGYTYSFRKGSETVTVGADTENALCYGLNFQQQWDRAIAADPDFIFVTGWNEWIAGRWKQWEGVDNAFPDQFSEEYSRDIEPADGILKDHFYYQLAANIRRFKGISDDTITENGVKTYYHYTGSTPARNSDGWQGLHYTNPPLRNDFVKAQVQEDGDTLVFHIYTKGPVQLYDERSMRILIDTDDASRTPNWEGFEYIIGRTGRTADTVRIEQSTGGWQFKTVGNAAYTGTGCEMCVRVPKSALGLSGDAHLRFKLSDGMQNEGDILDFYKNGDVAPGGRFTFVY